MRTLIAFAVVCLPLGVVAADDVFPTKVGTIWKYQMTQEFGRGVRPSAGQGLKIDADGKVRFPMTIKVAGTEKIDGVDVYKFELRRQDELQTIQFLQVNDHGVFEIARGDGTGEKLKLNPPQKLLGVPLNVGDKWEYHGEGDGQKVDETYEVIAKESIEVAAGKFEAYHVRVIGKQPFNSVVDRWYAPGVGEVKDITEVRRPDGSMIQRLSFELTAMPSVPTDR